MRYGVSNHQLHDCLLNNYSGADRRKYQSSDTLAFVRETNRWLVNSPHKGPVKRKIFPFDDVIMAVPADGELTVLVHQQAWCWVQNYKIFFLFLFHDVAMFSSYQRSWNCYRRSNWRRDLTNLSGIFMDKHDRHLWINIINMSVSCTIHKHLTVSQIDMANISALWLDIQLHEPRISYPSGHWPETVTNAHVSAHFR